MAYEAKDFSQLIGLDGFSEELLTTHFGLYEGYVKNTNKLIEQLADKNLVSPEWDELKRRFGWEFNGMRLHELYFENMTKEESSCKEECPELIRQMDADFGVKEHSWKEDFIATGSMRGIGWTVLYLDLSSKRLFNTWVNEHDVGHLSGCTPLLVMDVFEHAFVMDYGMKRADYIEAFFNAIDWSVVNNRFKV
ncbi:MAG: Fe-Mn family superoxide dismutase [Candidatus Kerfeldbacteria bacterium]